MAESEAVYGKGAANKKGTCGKGVCPFLADDRKEVVKERESCVCVCVCVRIIAREREPVRERAIKALSRRYPGSMKALKRLHS